MDFYRFKRYALDLHVFFTMAVVITLPGPYPAAASALISAFKEVCFHAMIL